MADDAPPPSRTGLLLYANLLDPDSKPTAGTISRAPVTFAQPAAATGVAESAKEEQEPKLNAALRFQPTKRPLAGTKPKPKPSSHRAYSNADAAPAAASESTPPEPVQAMPKYTIDDWAGDDDMDGVYYNENRRGGRKRRKKNKAEQIVMQDWDDIYDPSRPNTYEEYRNSEEQVREIRDWKDELYAHRMRRDSNASSVDERPMNKSFAPPASYSFAPPSFDKDPVPPPPPADLPDDSTGDDAYARRLRLSQAGAGQPPPPPPSEPPPGPPPGPPPPAAPPPTISRAPVRYNLPAAPSDLPESEADLEAALAAEAESEEPPPDAPRSLRPGQKGFAQRFMQKYGWAKGQGLGAGGKGIVNPLRVEVEKRKKRADAEGGGWLGPAGKGKIIGSRQAKGGDEPAPALSEVVALQGFVDGASDVADVIQGIGDECAKKYGRVERVIVQPARGLVFVKFTSQLSALRALGERAQYYDAGAFDAGEYGAE